MLEDSINSSPHKGNRSIQNSRLRRQRHKERRQNPEKNDHKKEKLRMPTLEDLYWEDSDGEDPHSKPSVPIKLQYGANFDPFEDELLLAAADRVDCSQVQRSSQFQKISTGQRFLKCSQILENANDSTNGTPPKEKTCGMNTEFGFSETELLNFVTAAEENPGIDKKPKDTKDSAHLVHTPQMKKNKSVVESILDDFCSSPISPEDPFHEYSTHGSTPSVPDHDLTPVFRFQNKPIRTYSRCRKGARTNIAKRLERVITSPDHNDDNMSNCSSELSIQEDLTQPNFETPSNTVNLNDSIKVCENLHNLSVYFTQLSKETSEANSSHEEFPPAEAAVEDLNSIDSLARLPDSLTKLIEEIITLREKYKIVLDNDTSVDFYGFATKEDELFLESNYVECNKEANEIEQLFEAGSATSNFMCKFSKSEDELFVGSDDEWNDECEFFKNFKTQNVLKNQITTTDEENQMHEHLQGKNEIVLKENFKCPKTTIRRLSDMPSTSNAARSFQRDETIRDLTCSNHNPHVTENIDADLDNIQFSEWFLEENSTENSEEVDIQELHENEPVTNNMIGASNGHENLGFQTASKKSIKISDEARAKADSFLKSLPEADALFKDKSDLPNEAPSDGQELGFQTASKKSIKISDKARAKANSFLKSLPEADALFKDVSGISNDVPSDDQELLGFQTASKKSIKISEKARAKADSFLKSLPEANAIFKDVSDPPNDAASDGKELGFQTASKKSIKISDKARAKAESFLKSLPEADALFNDVSDIPNDAPSDGQELLGFQTATKKSIKISDKARAKAESFLKSLPEANAIFIDVSDLPNDAPDHQEFLGFQTASKKSIKISDEARAKADSFLKSLPEVDALFKDVSDLPNDAPSDHQEFLGFQTASKKSIKISDEARAKADSFLKSLPEADALLKDVIDDDLHIPIIKSKFEKVGTECASNAMPKSKLEEITEMELKDIQLSEWQLDEEPETDSGLIKRKVDNLEDSSEYKPATKWLCKANSGNSIQRTPLTAHMENSPSARIESLSCDSPLTTMKKSTLISRKNLLSLSKRKKGRNAESHKRLNTMASDCKATPNKIPNVLQTPSTPNLKEFFDSVPNSSTPRPSRTDHLKQSDTDFQQIKWEECNDSLSKSRLQANASFTKLSDGSCDNISVSIANPSPKQRIERLRMYGEPPPISPAVISLKNNCRPSGLRRGRSMIQRQSDSTN